MAEVFENLNELQEKYNKKAAEEQQSASENQTPAEGKKTLKEKFAASKKARVTKKIKRELKKITKLEEKLVPKDANHKIHIDRKKLIIGGGVIGAATLGAIGAAVLKHGGLICEKNDIPCEEAVTPDCCEQPVETDIPEVQVTEAVET